jgi:hypothetical protein
MDGSGIGVELFLLSLETGVGGNSLDWGEGGMGEGQRGVGCIAVLIIVVVWLAMAI